MEPYNCERCGDEWRFCPEDYDFVEEDYPVTCPFCDMSLGQLFKDVYETEGLWEAIKQVSRRLF